MLGNNHTHQPHLNPSSFYIITIILHYTNYITPAKKKKKKKTKKKKKKKKKNQFLELKINFQPRLYVATNVHYV